jgi:hypothetical protein
MTQDQLAPKGMNLSRATIFHAVADQGPRLDQVTYLDHGFLTVTFKSAVEHAKEDPHRVR